MNDYEYNESEYKITIKYNDIDLSKYFRIYASFGIHDEIEQFFAIDFFIPNHIFSGAEAISSQLLSADVFVDNRPYRILQENPIRISSIDGNCEIKALLLPK